MIDKNLKLSEITKLAGVADLPMKVRGRFAMALRDERDGNHEAAAVNLDKAIAAELAI